MPIDFEKCVKNGGRIRRISGPSKQFNLNKDQYINICFINGEMYRGEVKTKQKK
jgi:hypothetical protein